MSLFLWTMVVDFTLSSLAKIILRRYFPAVIDALMVVWALMLIYKPEVF